MELDIQVIQQHLFWKRDDDLCILLDTGSPMSFGNVEFNWRGKRKDLSTNMELLDLKDLSDTIDTRVDAILGADLLLEGPMFLTFVEDRIRLGPAQGVGTIPVVDISIDGILKKVCIDTGAKQSFILSKLVEDVRTDQSASVSNLESHHQSSFLQELRSLVRHPFAQRMLHLDRGYH